jgi:hypothetical protein
VHYLPVCDRYIEYQCDRIVPILASTPHLCPSKLVDLTNLLVRDLPSYANRTIQRRRKRTDELYSSIVTVSAPDFKPIEIVSREYPPQFPQSQPQQVFITTLERQYTGIRSTELQQFHWLFMAQTRQGWRLVNIYSRTGATHGVNAPITPPVESSKTIVGESIRVWLNDCHFGKVRAIHLPE